MRLCRLCSRYKKTPNETTSLRMKLFKVKNKKMLMEILLIPNQNQKKLKSNLDIFGNHSELVKIAKSETVKSKPTRFVMTNTANLEVKFLGVVVLGLKDVTKECAQSMQDGKLWHMNQTVLTVHQSHLLSIHVKIASHYWQMLS